MQNRRVLNYARTYRPRLADDLPGLLIVLAFSGFFAAPWLVFYLVTMLLGATVHWIFAR